MCDDNYETLISCFEKQVSSARWHRLSYWSKAVGLSLTHHNCASAKQAVVRPDSVTQMAFKVPKKLFFLMMVTQKSSQVLSAKNMKGFEKGGREFRVKKINDVTKIVAPQLLLF